MLILRINYYLTHQDFVIILLQPSSEQVRPHIAAVQINKKSLDNSAALLYNVFLIADHNAYKYLQEIKYA